MTIAMSLNGLFARAENGGDDHSVVNFYDTTIGAHETFKVWQLGDGFVALETANGRFLSHPPQGQWQSSRARRSDTKARADLRNVPDDVVSLPHDAWESFDWFEIQRTYIVTVIEPDAPPEPPHQSRPYLQIVGNDFVAIAGERQVLSGCDGFTDLRRFRDGGEAALLPFLHESNDLEFTVRRVWSQGSKRQNTVMDLSPTEPGYYDSIRPFVDTLNAHGIIPLLTCYVDNQDVQSPLSHWTNLADRVRGSSCLLSGFNQWSKNKSTFGPDDLADLGHEFAWSRGSDVDDTKTPPHGAPASELHSTRISFDRSLMDSVASPINMRQNGSTMVWMTEGIPVEQSTDPFVMWQLARCYATCWALAVFHHHTPQGQLMSGGIRRCAEAWRQGMWLA